MHIKPVCGDYLVSSLMWSFNLIIMCSWNKIDRLDTLYIGRPIPSMDIFLVALDMSFMSTWVDLNRCVMTCPTFQRRLILF